MVSDPFSGDGAFARAVAAKLDEKLKERLANESSKRQPVLTDINILATVEAVNDVVLTNPPYPSWPSNEPPMIEVSADKRTEWLRECLAEIVGMENVTVSSCLGQKLDLQVRQGDNVLLNMETELGGNRQRAEDMAKLTSHQEQPLVSVMMVREKSFKHIEGTLRNLEAASADRKEPFINVVEYWPDKAPLNTATPIIAVTQGGEELSGDQDDDEDWDEDCEGGEPNFDDDDNDEVEEVD